MSIHPLAGFSFRTDQSLQHQLRQALSQKILNGEIAAGTQLPSSRKLAQDLGLGRNTVTMVYDQLKQEGLIRSKQGAGMFVSEGIQARFQSEQGLENLEMADLPPISNSSQKLLKTPVSSQAASLPFAVGVPDLKAFPDKIWNRLQRAANQRPHLLGYTGIQGLLELRIAIAEYLQLSRAVKCQPDQIIVTAGAQAALSLVSQTLLNPGDKVLIENPGYQGAMRAFSSRPCNLEAIPLKNSKLDISKLPSRTHAKLLYCTPTHQYPLGGILDSSERLQLLHWARQHNIWLLEDDYDSEYHFNSKPFPAIQGMDTRSPVIYLGSFSKTLFPALRLGYLVVPSQLVDVFLHAKRNMSGETSPALEATLAEFISEGHFYRHLRKMRTLYHTKWLELTQLCETYLQGYASILASQAGMHMVLTFDYPNDKTAVNELVALGVHSKPLSNYFLPDIKEATDQNNGLVIGFGNTPTRLMPELVHKIRLVLTQSH